MIDWPIFLFLLGFLLGAIIVVIILVAWILPEWRWKILTLLIFIILIVCWLYLIWAWWVDYPFDWRIRPHKPY